MYDIGQLTGFVGLLKNLGSGLAVLLTNFACNASSPMTNNKSVNRSTFITDTISFLNVSYPGATPKIFTYNADKINLETGNLMSRTNLTSNSSATFVSDTVTEL